MRTPHALVTLNVTPSWQPTTRNTDKTADFYAFPSAHVVDCHVRFSADKVETTTMHGEWPATDEGKRNARRFAASYGDATVREVPEYWYAPAFGKVEVDPARVVRGEESGVIS